MLNYITSVHIFLQRSFPYLIIAVIFALRENYIKKKNYRYKKRVFISRIFYFNV